MPNKCRHHPLLLENFQPWCGREVESRELHHCDEGKRAACVESVRVSKSWGKVCMRVSWIASVVSNSVWPYGLCPTRLLWPWNSPGKNTGVGCRVLLQGIFPTHGLNPHLLSLMHWQAGSLPLAPPGRGVLRAKACGWSQRSWLRKASRAEVQKKKPASMVIIHPTLQMEKQPQSKAWASNIAVRKWSVTQKRRLNWNSATLMCSLHAKIILKKKKELAGVLLLTFNFRGQEIHRWTDYLILSTKAPKACGCCLVPKSLFCDSVDCSPPGSSVHGLSQARILEWVALSFSRGSSWLRNRTCVSCVGRQILYH